MEFRHHYYRLVGATYARQHLDDMLVAEREVDAAWARRIANSLRAVTL